MRMRKTIGLSLALLLVSAPAIAKRAHPAHPDPQRSLHPADASPAAAAVRSRSTQPPSCRARNAHSARPRHRATRPQAMQEAGPDRYIGPLRAAGVREIGYAAWYGGRHIGRRTASGSRLDAVHATAAHRSLPLNSLVRVTNLRNGRSVIATITDRGPVSRRLLIDVSPSAAAELDMVHSGIANVAVEPVVETAELRPQAAGPPPQAAIPSPQIVSQAPQPAVGQAPQPAVGQAPQPVINPGPQPTVTPPQLATAQSAQAATPAP